MKPNRNPFSKDYTPAMTSAEREYIRKKNLMINIYDNGLRLTFDSYLKLVEEFPSLYSEVPDDIKCQELELASKL